MAASTIGYMPMMECPACGHEWQWDDYYDVREGTTRECPYCKVEIEVVEAEALLHCRLNIAKEEQ